MLEVNLEITLIYILNDGCVATKTVLQTNMDDINNDLITEKRHSLNLL